MLSRFDECRAQMEPARELDPRSPVTNSHLGWTLYFARRFADSAERLRLTVEMDPGFALASYFAGLTYLQLEQFDGAIRQFERGEQLSPGHPPVLSGLGQAYALKRMPGEARKYIDALNAMSLRRHVSPFFIACVHVRLGEMDRAMACLENAYEQGCPWMALLNVEPSVDALRGDSRFRGLLKRIGFPEV